jgi:hypothetical protein
VKPTNFWVFSRNLLQHPLFFGHERWVGAERTGFLKELIFWIHLLQIFSLKNQPCKTQIILTL